MEPQAIAISPAIRRLQPAVYLSRCLQFDLFDFSHESLTFVGEERRDYDEHYASVVRTSTFVAYPQVRQSETEVVR